MTLFLHHQPKQLWLDTSRDSAGRRRLSIIRIQPDFNKTGRQYNVEAISYVPLIASNPNDELVIELSGSLFDVNLFARAGAPNIPINVTFVLNNCTIGSTAFNVPSVRAGNFEVGSRIKIICTNGTKWSAKGGENFSYTFQASLPLPQSGSKYNGGDSYDSDGIETELYLNYGSVDGYTTSGELFASGGAGGVGAVDFFGLDMYIHAVADLEYRLELAVSTSTHKI